MQEVSLRGLVREMDAEELFDFITANIGKLPALDISYCLNQYFQLTGRRPDIAPPTQQQQP